MHRKVEALRPLLRGVVLATIVLAGADLLMKALRHWPGLGLPAFLDDAYLSVAIPVLLLAIVLLLNGRLARLLDRAEAAARLQQQVLDALEAGLVLFDANGRIVFCNRHFLRLYGNLGAAARPGASYEQLLRAVMAHGMVPDATGEEEAWIAHRLSEFGRTGTGLMRRVRDGTWRRIDELRLHDGSVLAHIVDVSELMAKEEALEAARRDAEQSQHELARSRQRLEDAIEALPAGFELYDAEDRLTMVNRMNLQMYPQLADLRDQRPTFEDVVRTNAARGGLPFLATPQQLNDWIERRSSERGTSAEGVIHQIAEGRWIRTYERRTHDGGMVAIRLDVSELVQREQELGLLNARLAQLNQELSVLSQTDALTGLANRRAFDQRLAEELSRVARHDVPLSLLVVDIDHFKSYNDHYGHPAGDACLRQVAEALRECAARPIDLVARLGGEEFALLLPHLDGADAVQVGERCLQAVEAAAIAHAGSPVAPRVTVSVGVAQSTQLEGDGAALLAAADAALYAAKRQGRRRVVLAARD
jgi:diguanylate cyclase (GGDEF)-like protein